ncbi:acyl-CoA thioesterase [Desulfomicrobium escambiense]|uniref:acyl-CoA thioesterase n=1 Tax=Desulfomicrobium escambiense TaxID=29503 RepID=UPI001FE01E49|nr:acyl-CoA thioesterase [Desulfomicrobium escambiense]
MPERNPNPAAPVRAVAAPRGEPMSEPDRPGRQPKGLLVLRTLAMPKDTNPNGDIFGGWMLAQMDVAGGLMASEIAKGRTVTVSVEKMSFDKPVKVGDTVCIYAELQRVGTSSMDIKLEVWARQLVGAYEAERQLVTEGLFRYVAVDENRRPRKVPDNPLFFKRD